MKKPILLLFILFTSSALLAQEEDLDPNRNVIVNNSLNLLELNADYPFAAPEDFTAESVSIQRNISAGTATFCLPFEVSASEIDGSAEMGIYHHVDNTSEKVMFEKCSCTSANTPFLMSGIAATNGLVFGQKKVIVTPASLGEVFVGTYGGLQSGEGLWGIATKPGWQGFMQGGSGAKIRSFQAYLTDIGGSAGARELMFIDEATRIHNVNDNDNLKLNTQNSELNVFDLQGCKVSKPGKGVYIVNGKKVIVK